jgi:uncharacterized protein YndB with AHSA1/START domain
MPSPLPAGELELTSSRWFPVPADRIWAQCTSKPGLESWWSPEDIRTTVKRIDPRPGGELVLSLRYAPAMLGHRREEDFQAAGVPIAFLLRGIFLEFEVHRRVTLALTLTVDRRGGGVETVTQLDFQPESGGTRIQITVRGKSEPHMVTLGKANLDGQLERLGHSVGLARDPPP